jgi:hypothetical protein
MAKKKKGYQSGRTVNPRAAATAARRRNAPKQRRIRFEGPDWSGLLSRQGGTTPGRTEGTPPAPPGGWAEGGAVETYSEQVKRKYGGGKL